MFFVSWFSVVSRLRPFVFEGRKVAGLCTECVGGHAARFRA